MIDKPKLLFVGCGHMGGAMLRHWLAADSFDQAYVVKPSPLLPALEDKARIHWTVHPQYVPADFSPDIIIIAVRPKDLASVLPSYAHYAKSLFLSLAAGKKIAQLSNMLGPASPLLRAMPNIASEVGKGMTFLTCNSYVHADQQKAAEKLLSAIGEIAWLEDESLFDAATTLSSCGPGYVFALIESMASAGEALGLPADFSMKLARQTIIGSGALLEQSDQSATALRQAIGNPGTMTEAALKHLLAQDGLPTLLLTAMKAAIKRADELAK